MKDTWESASAKQSQTLCVLAWNQLIHQKSHWITPNMPMSLPIGTTTANPANTSPRMPWQLLGADYFHFDGSEYLVGIDYYSKMPIARRIPASQCNVSKTISVLKELFTEHGIPEALHTDSAPQFANTLFTEFATGWKFNHNASSLRNPRSNGQAEAAIKTVKGLLTHAKCSSQGP